MIFASKHILCGKGMGNFRVWFIIQYVFVKWINFLIPSVSKFYNFQMAFSVFWQSYFQLPKLAWLFSKKKEPVEPENNSEKKKKVAHSQWNEKIDQFHKNTFEIMNQNLKFPMPLPHKMCSVKNIIYHLPLVVGFRCKNKKK